MTTTTLDIFDLLVDAGIEAEKAKPLAKEILSRAEAKEVLATKLDLSLLKSEIYKAMMIQTGATVAILSAMYAMFG